MNSSPGLNLAPVRLICRVGPALPVVLWLIPASLLGLFMVGAGNVFPDEGWYLYAARLVSEGQVPYRDFAYLQAPLAPYIFAPFRGDFLATRLFCLTLGLVSIGLMLSLSHREGPWALLVSAGLLVFSGYTMRWLVITRNISPAVCFIALGFFTFRPDDSRRLALAGIFFALATATRTSALGFVVALGLISLIGWTSNEQESKESPQDALTRIFWATIPAAVTLLVTFGTHLALDPSNFYFCNLGYHTGLHDSSVTIGSHVVAKIQNLFRFNDKHLLVTLCGLVGIWGVGFEWKRWRTAMAQEPRIALVSLGAALVTILHLIPGRLHPEYHELILLPVAWLVAHMIQVCIREKWILTPTRRVVGTFLILSTAQVLGVSGHIWMNKGWCHADLQRLAQRVEKHLTPDSPLFTFVPDLALIAHRDLMPGLEMASVSLAAPGLESGEVRDHHMLNLQHIKDAFENRRPGVVVWADLEDADSRRVGLYPSEEIRSVQRALKTGYRPVETQGLWTIWIRRLTPSIP